MMDKRLYEFNPSQDVVNLQTKYTLFKRVENILFKLSFEEGFDRSKMTEAIDKLFERNDSLRIRFTKKNGKTLQYFEDSRHIEDIPERVFKTWKDQDKFYKRFRRKKNDCFKGVVLKAVYAVNPSGTEEIYFKISHFVADTYGIGVIVSDLLAIYKSLLEGTPMPPVPGSFENVLSKEMEYKDNSELKSRDEEYFKNYYEVRHNEAPMYCGVHGSSSDEWLKVKNKGQFAMPYYFVKCDTEGMRFAIPAILGKEAAQWCENHNVSLSAFFFYTFALSTSLINGKAAHLNPLMLLDCRGTLAERKAAGTKVQALSVYTTIDYNKSFVENINSAYEEQQELYKHTRLTYLDVEAIQHRVWGHSMLSSTYGFTYSFISMKMPDGVRMQVLSNGKCSLTAYVALMFNPETFNIDVLYDVQTMLTTPAVLADFHNTYLRVIEKVLSDSDSALNNIF